MSASWLIGSIEDSDAMGVTIAGSGQTIAAGSYYLHGPTNALSLLYHFQTAMTAASVGSAAAYLTEAGYVRLTGSGTFTVTWTNTTLRDLLGFTGNLSGASSYVAPNHSKLWWSAGYDVTPETPYGVESMPMPDTSITTSRDGSQVLFTTNNTQHHQKFSWDVVGIDRVWTSAEAGGEYKAWWDTVGRAGLRWYLWPDVDEDSGSTTQATLSGPLGPYKLRRIDPGWYNRQIPGVDQLSEIEIDAIVVSEYA
jgi:hypothetical protein